MIWKSAALCVRSKHERLCVCLFVFWPNLHSDNCCLMMMTESDFSRVRALTQFSEIKNVKKNMDVVF